MCWISGQGYLQTKDLVWQYHRYQLQKNMSSRFYELLVQLR
jgi:hypothetical protein